MIGRTNTGGGRGIADAFAVIAVTYPEGSVCTCANGNKVLKAKDTSGSYPFMIPEPGAWTVTATDGTQTASKQVDIDKLYQAETVNLTYDLVLFDFGDECTDITGGWLAKGKKGGSEGWGGKTPTVTKYIGYYEIAFSGSGGGLYTTTNKIDLSGYKTLKMLFQHEKAWGKHSAFGAWDNGNVIMNGFTNTAAKYILETNSVYNEDVELSVDISAVSGSWNVGIGSYSATANKLNFLKKVWATNEV